jgi:small basic protein
MRQPNLDIFYFSESRIQLASNIISTAFCAILLLGAMAVLAVLHNSSWKIRLGVVALFTTLFAGVVGLLTNARRAEIFASSAAYAAVLVVYVSGNLGPPATGG